MTQIPELVEGHHLTIRRISVSSMDNNVYLLTSRATGDQVLIDAADDPGAIESLLAAASGDAESPSLRHILTTHSHHDHIGALAAVATAHPDAETLAGEADADAITAATGVRIDRRLRHGDTLILGGIELAVIGLRGHPGVDRSGLFRSGRCGADLHRRFAVPRRWVTPGTIRHDSRACSPTSSAASSRSIAPRRSSIRATGVPPR